MNRRHWLRSLFGLVAGFWAAGPAPAAAPRPAPRSQTPRRPALPGPGCCQVTTYMYHAGNRLRCIADGPVTTYVYDAGGMTYDG